MVFIPNISIELIYFTNMIQFHNLEEPPRKVFGSTPLLNKDGKEGVVKFLELSDLF